MGAGCGHRRACCHRGHVQSGTVYIDNSLITCSFIVTARGGGVFDDMLMGLMCPLELIELFLMIYGSRPKRI